MKAHTVRPQEEGPLKSPDRRPDAAQSRKPRAGVDHMRAASGQCDPDGPACAGEHKAVVSVYLCIYLYMYISLSLYIYIYIYICISICSISKTPPPRNPPRQSGKRGRGLRAPASQNTTRSAAVYAQSPN